jgi:hypothetical protein
LYTKKKTHILRHTAAVAVAEIIVVDDLVLLFLIQVDHSLTSVHW